MGCHSKGEIGASWATWALPVFLCDLLGLPGASWAIQGLPVSTWAVLGSNLIVFVRISAVLAMSRRKNTRNVRGEIGSHRIL